MKSKPVSATKRQPAKNVEQPGALSRRGFVQQGLMAAAGATWLSSQAAGKESPAASAQPATQPASPASLPCGQLGGARVSRLILGSNLITGSLHSRDLGYVRELCKGYNTEERILETFATAEANGINTFMSNYRPEVLALVRKYRSTRGSPLQWIVAPMAEVDDFAAYDEQVRMLMDAGAVAMYVYGGHGDRAVREKKLDALRKAVDIIKANDIPAGVAGHSLETVTACEQAKVGADFYVKTFHHHNYASGPKPGEATKDYQERAPAYWCRNPEETAASMKTVAKPWVAYKVMAAGAIPPRDAFRHAFANGADFILAGMFDFQIAEDARMTREILAGKLQRARPWCA